MNFEFLNKVILRGCVGIAKVDSFHDKKLVSFSVVTEYAYQDENNNHVINTTWFNVRAWEGSAIKDVTAIKKGDVVEIEGRQVCRRYTDANGNDRTMYEVKAQKVRVLGNFSVFGGEDIVQPEQTDVPKFIKED